MKKTILFFVLLLAGITQAQEYNHLIWLDEFDGTPQFQIDGATHQDWKFYSLDNEAYTWNIGKNWVWSDNSNSYVDGDMDILNYKPYSKASVNNLNPPIDDWVVSPEIDLTGASGNLLLAINFQNDDIAVSNRLDVYISTVPDVQTIKNSNPLVQLVFNKPQFVVEFTEKTIDITQFAGKKIYIAFGKKSANNNVLVAPSEIDYVQILSDKSLSTTEVKSGKSLTKVMQNPVGNSLMLQLNPAMAAAKTAVQVYNVAGQQVLNAKYSKEISVAQLAPGMYLARVTDGNLTETVKFIKK